MKPTDTVMVFGMVLVGGGGLGAALTGCVGLTTIAGLGALTCLAGFGIAALGAALGMILHAEQ